MCGRLNVINSPEVTQLCEFVGVSFDWHSVVNAVPTNEIPIIFECGGKRQIEPAIWWFLLKKSLGGFNPDSAWETFNAVAKGIHTSRLYCKPFRTSRCIIPASGYYEWKAIGRKRYPYYITDVPGDILYN